jgi:hypothetical protein
MLASGNNIPAGRLFAKNTQQGVFLTLSPRLGGAGSPYCRAVIANANVINKINSALITLLKIVTAYLAHFFYTQ